MYTKIIVAKNLEEAKKIAEEHKGKALRVAVEAEWGDNALDMPDVEIALNHHGIRANNPCPSEIGVINDSYIIPNETKVAILSHLDADTIMGLMWVNGNLDRSHIVTKEIAKMVAYSDKHGYHKARKKYKNIMGQEVGKKWLALGLLFSRNCKTSPGDVTEKVLSIIYAADAIIKAEHIDDLVIYKEAVVWEEKKRENALDSLTYKDKTILGFAGKYFYCDNYDLLEEEREIIIQFDLNTRAITLAAIDKETAIKYFGENGVIKPLQDFFGTEAGGHIAIGGSPRNKKYEWKDYKKFIKYIRELVRRD